MLKSLLPAALALGFAAEALAVRGPEHRTLRPLAMGNAFVAVAEDKEALHYNPAGLNLMGRVGNRKLRPEMGHYPQDRFDMHMDFLGTGLPVNEALDILRFYQDHEQVFSNPDSLRSDTEFSRDLSRFDRESIRFAVLHGGELAFHNFGMSYWADAQMAPYADVGILLPQAGVEYVQLDLVGEIGAATSYFEDRMSLGLEYRMAKRERIDNTQISLLDLATIDEVAKDTLDAKISSFSDLSSIGHGMDIGVLWQQTRSLRFGGAVQNLFMQLNHEWVVPELTVGLAYSPIRFQSNGKWKRKINLALDLEDLLSAERNYRPLGKLNFGGEWEQTLIPWVLKGRLALGCKGGYLTAGLGGDLFTVLHYEVATWAEEGGYYTGQREDRYYVMKFGIGL